MASSIEIQPFDTDAGLDSNPHENRPETSPPQNLDSNSVRVEFDNLDSGGEQGTEPPSIINKCISFLKRYKPLYYLICFLFFICLLPLAYACVTAATFCIIPLLLVALVGLRMLQFVTRLENFQKLFKTKLLLHYWTAGVVMLLLVEVAIFYPIAKYLPELKLVMIIGLPITKWIQIICILIGLYLVSFVVWVVSLVYIIGDREDESGFGLLFLEGVIEIIGCFLFRWAVAEVMNSVPTFKQSKIFLIYTQTWIEVSVFVLIGYQIITLFTHLLVWLLSKGYRDHLRVIVYSLACFDLGRSTSTNRYKVYVAYGIKSSVISILCAVMLLLTWVLYFGNHLKATSHNKKVFEFGVSTLVSVLICSFLWLIKSCIMLYWEAHIAYDRLHSKIAEIGKELYILVLLSYTHFQRVSFIIDVMDSPGNGKREELWVLVDNSLRGEFYECFRRKTVRKKLIENTGPKSSLYDIKQAAEQIVAAHYTLSQNISRHIKHLQRRKQKDHDDIYSGSDSDSDSDSDSELSIDVLKKMVISDGEHYCLADWEMLHHFIPIENDDMTLLLNKVKIWMETAHRRCRFLANALTDQKEAAKCLNQVISWLIIGGTFITWLLISGLASTSVLVLVSTPLLAASFIFGETCKNLFQGLMSVYVFHPFEIGDLCLIDGKLLEVKRINIRGVVLSEVRSVGMQHEIIYTYSELATKNVINYKNIFDWRDYIEFSLSFQNGDAFNELTHKILSFLDKNKKLFTPNFHSMEFTEMGDTNKVTVRFEHNVQSDGWTHFECLKVKEKRRLEFSLHLRTLLNKYEARFEKQEINSEQDETRDD